MPTAEARYQSAGAVHMEMRSPKPARFMAGGALASVVRSTMRASGQREGTVRLVPLLRSTETSSEKALTEAAVCTTTSGASVRAVASLQTSVTVPDPTTTTQSASATAALASDSASSSAWSCPLPSPSTARLTSNCRASRSSASTFGSPSLRRIGVASIASTTCGGASWPAPVNSEPTSGKRPRAAAAISILLMPMGASSPSGSASARASRRPSRSVGSAQASRSAALTDGILPAIEDGLKCCVGCPVEGVCVVVGGLGAGVRFVGSAQLHEPIRRLVQRGVGALGHASQHGRPRGSGLLILQGAEHAPRGVRLRLAPKRALCATAHNAHLFAFDAHRCETVHDVPEAEGAPLEHGPRHVREPVLHREPVEDAPGVAVPGRRHSSAQARQEDEAFRARGHAFRLPGHLLEAHLCDIIRVPADAAAGDEAGVLYEPQPRVGVGVGLDEAGLVEDRLIRRCAYGFGGARDVADEVRDHQARSEASPMFVTATHDDLGADPETDVPGRGLGQDTGHLLRRGYPP